MNWLPEQTVRDGRDDPWDDDPDGIEGFRGLEGGCGRGKVFYKPMQDHDGIELLGPVDLCPPDARRIIEGWLGDGDDVGEELLKQCSLWNADALVGWCE